MCPSRAIEELFLSNGAAIGYWQGDIMALAGDIEALKPTLFIGVPRVFDRVREGALATVNRRGPISKLIFKWALARKLYYLNAGCYATKASLHAPACLLAPMLRSNRPCKVALQ